MSVKKLKCYHEININKTRGKFSDEKIIKAWDEAKIFNSDSDNENNITMDKNLIIGLILVVAIILAPLIYGNPNAPQIIEEGKLKLVADKDIKNPNIDFSKDDKKILSFNPWDALVKYNGTSKRIFSYSSNATLFNGSDSKIVKIDGNKITIAYFNKAKDPSEIRLIFELNNNSLTYKIEGNFLNLTKFEQITYGYIFGDLNYNEFITPSDDLIKNEGNESYTWQGGIQIPKTSKNYQLMLSNETMLNVSGNFTSIWNSPRWQVLYFYVNPNETITIKVQEPINYTLNESNDNLRFVLSSNFESFTLYNQSQKISSFGTWEMWIKYKGETKRAFSNTLNDSWFGKDDNKEIKINGNEMVVSYSNSGKDPNRIDLIFKLENNTLKVKIIPNVSETEKLEIIYCSVYFDRSYENIITPSNDLIMNEGNGTHTYNFRSGWGAATKKYYNLDHLLIISNKTTLDISGNFENFYKIYIVLKAQRVQFQFDPGETLTLNVQGNVKSAPVGKSEISPNIYSSLMSVFKIIILLFIIVVVPWIILLQRKDDYLLDLFFRGLIIGSFLTFGIGSILSIFKLYSLTTFLIFYFAIIVIGFVARYKMGGFSFNYRQIFRLRNNYDLLASLLFLVILLLTSYILFYSSIIHYALPYTDSLWYFNWINSFNNDGIIPNYPAYMMLISLLGISINDIHSVLKFIGPLIGVLTTIAIYFIISRLTDNKGIALFAMFLTTVYISYGFLGRMGYTLAQEFGLLFLILSFYYGLTYLLKGGKSHFFIYSLCLVLIFMTHDGVASVAIAGFLCLFVVGMAFHRSDINNRTWNVLIGFVYSMVFSYAYYNFAYVHSYVISFKDFSYFMHPPFASHIAPFFPMVIAFLIFIIIFKLIYDKLIYDKFVANNNNVQKLKNNKIFIILFALACLIIFIVYGRTHGAFTQFFPTFEIFKSYFLEIGLISIIIIFIYSMFMTKDDNKRILILFFVLLSTGIILTYYDIGGDYANYRLKPFVTVILILTVALCTDIILYRSTHSFHGLLPQKISSYLSDNKLGFLLKQNHLITIIMFLFLLFTSHPYDHPLNFKEFDYGENIKSIQDIMENFSGQDVIIYLPDGYTYYKEQLIESYKYKSPHIFHDKHSKLISIHPAIFKPNHKHTFIFIEKPEYINPAYSTLPRKKPYNLTEIEDVTLKWCQEYKNINNNTKIYFENKNLIIYYVENDN